MLNHQNKHRIQLDIKSLNLGRYLNSANLFFKEKCKTYDTNFNGQISFMLKTLAYSNYYGTSLAPLNFYTLIKFFNKINLFSNNCII